MAVVLQMPQLGITMQEGKIIDWLVAEGDDIAVGMPIYEVETDKYSNTVESDIQGTLLKIVARKGVDVPAHGMVAIVGEASRQFEVPSDTRIALWERIYLTEGAEGLAIERRGRGSKGRPGKLPPAVEKDLLTEVQRLRAENVYLKNLQALVLEDERKARKKRW